MPRLPVFVYHLQKCSILYLELKDEIFQLDYKSNKRIADLAEELRRLREFKEKQNAYFNQINYYKVKYEELSKNDHQIVINNNNIATSQQGPLITEKLPGNQSLTLLSSHSCRISKVTGVRE